METNMANSSTTGFGLRPIKKVGQNDNNGALSEWSIASGSALISHNDMCQVTADGVVLVSGNAIIYNLGSLNGSFYTDPTSNKPTWSNYWPASVAASDAVAFITDDPYQMYEIMSADTAFNQNEVGGCADGVAAVGVTPLFISKTKISATTSSTQAQFKILGVSRDPDHSDITEEGFALRVKINEHFMTALGGL
jgi:hypothetical protein